MREFRGTGKLLEVERGGRVDRESESTREGGGWGGGGGGES